MIKKLILSILLSVACWGLNAQIEEIEAGWKSKTIGNVASAKLPVLVEKFNQTWPYGAVSEALDVMKQGLAEKILDEETGNKVVYDARNGFVGIMDEGADNQYMSACVWRRSNGHSLFAIVLGQPVDPDLEFICFYDYNPQTRTLTPEPDVLADWSPSRDDSRLTYNLPRTGKELIISEFSWEMDKALKHNFGWDGMKPVFSYTDTYLSVSYSGDRPFITDFLAAICTQEELGECMGKMSYDWNIRQRGGKLDEGSSIVVDEKNGYIRHESRYENQLSYKEFCFWNCSDGKHKIVAANSGLLVDGKPMETECTGLSFYSYDGETNYLSFCTEDLGVDFGEEIQPGTAVTYCLPRTGKTIEATIHYPDGAVTVLLKWNGERFVK